MVLSGMSSVAGTFAGSYKLILAADVAPRQYDVEAFWVAGRFSATSQHGRQQQFQSAHCFNAYLVFLNDLRGYNALQLLFEYGKQRGYFTGRPDAQIISRQNPNDSNADGQVITPLQNFSELFSTLLVHQHWPIRRSTV